MEPASGAEEGGKAERCEKRGQKGDWRAHTQREAGASEEGGGKKLGREGEEGEKEASSHPGLGQAGSSWNQPPTPMPTEVSLPP